MGTKVINYCVCAGENLGMRLLCFFMYMYIVHVCVGYITLIG